jgi:hypothetical protein
MAALACSSANAKELLEQMKAIQVEAEKAVAAAREAQKVRDEAQTTRAQTRLEQDKVRLQELKINACRTASKSAEELGVCLAQVK